ncbi:MAG: hypothetical protein M5R36_22385 [Deltaproteobacteria bacterium]|nr:hypothetical protein [Deltaproteobacteria bacterium]
MRRLLLSMLLSVVIAAPAAAGGPDKRLREKLGLNGRCIPRCSKRARK